MRRRMLFESFRDGVEDRRQAMSVWKWTGSLGWSARVNCEWACNKDSHLRNNGVPSPPATETLNLIVACSAASEDLFGFTFHSSYLSIQTTSLSPLPVDRSC